MEDEEKTRAARLSVSRFWHEHNHVHATADNGLQRSYQSSTTELGHLGWFGLTSGVQTVSLCVRLQCCFVPWDKINQRKEKNEGNKGKKSFSIWERPSSRIPCQKRIKRTKRDTFSVGVRPFVRLSISRQPYEPIRPSNFWVPATTWSCILLPIHRHNYDESSSSSLHIRKRVWSTKIVFWRSLTRKFSLRIIIIVWSSHFLKSIYRREHVLLFNYYLWLLSVFSY